MTDPEPTADAPQPDPDADPTPPRPPRPTGPVQYRGADLESARGPGLGCFRIQLVVLVILIIATPLSVTANAPDWLSALLLFATLGLLLVSGQTIIFLLRLVAAERREGRRRPMAAHSQTVGELEDAAAPTPPPTDDPRPPTPDPTPDPEPDPEPGEPAPPPDDPVRQ